MTARWLAVAPACAGALAVVAGCLSGNAKPTEAPAVEVAGCTGWLDGRTCELGADRTLRVWAAATPASLRFRAGTSALTPTSSSAVGGGTLWFVPVPAGARALDVESTDSSVKGHLHVSLANAPVFPRILEARRLRAAGRTDEALQALTGVDAMDADERAAAYAFRARAELSLGYVDPAIDDFRRAIAARDPRRAAERVLDAVTLAFALNQRSHRFAEARAALAEAAIWSGGFPEGRALVAYNLALVAYETGDMRAALSDLDEATQRASRIGDAFLVGAVKEARALALLALGRRREAIEILEAFRGAHSAMDGCAEADLAIDLSWAWASCGEDDTLALCGVSAEDALREADHAAVEAIDAFPAVCSDPHLVANALVNAALVRLQQHDVNGTLAFLARSRSIVQSPSASVELFWLDLENRALLARGESTRALAGFEREAARAEALLASSMQWRAEIGIAEALERRGDGAGAIAAFARAETIAAEESLSVPLGEGRSSFLAERERATARHVDALLRAGRGDDALRVVRRARLALLEPLRWARDLAHLDAGARARWDEVLGTYRQGRAELESDAAGEWSLPKDEWQRARESRRSREAELGKLLDDALSREALGYASAPATSPRAPESGETLLVYQRIQGDTWVGFADTSAGVVAHHLGTIDADASPEVLSRILLEPFATEILGARRVTVLATGALRAVDFHALPWRGAPLVESAAVAYGLDLPASSAPLTADAEDPRHGRALVIGDPTGDLLAARAEADLASRALASDGWQVASKMTADARGDVVRDSLPGVELLHYAGHGVFAGADGWESALPLAASGTLSVGDLLSLREVPRLVVLAGCETGRSGDAKSAAGLGLAQAFLVSGAEQVLASGRAVDDGAAARDVAALYARPLGQARPDLVEQLARAQRVLWKGPDATGWQDLRVFVR